MHISARPGHGPGTVNRLHGAQKLIDKIHGRDRIKPTDTGRELAQ
jgi:hypothetical protein